MEIIGWSWREKKNYEIRESEKNIIDSEWIAIVSDVIRFLVGQMFSWIDSIEFARWNYE